MNYRYKKGQIFRKKLNLKNDILNKVYECLLTFDEYIKYELDDKIPITCIKESDRIIVEKFGIDKCKSLDWELLNKFGILEQNKIRRALLSIDSHTEDLNSTFYESIKNEIKPSNYSMRMKEKYADRLFDISSVKDDFLRNLMRNFNEGEIGLKTIIEHWNLFKDKDLNYCLLNDQMNKKNITDSDIKQFMSEYETLSHLITENNDIYSVISEISTLISEKEKREYIKKLTDDILKRELDKELTNNEYKEIFKYSSLREYLNKKKSTRLIEELTTLPDDYVFDIPIPFSILMNSNVLKFVEIYGLENIVDFDNECGHFFSNNNYRVLKIMNEMLINDINYTRKDKELISEKKDKDGNFRPYTKDEFYSALKIMIIHGPQNRDFRENYRNINGQFKSKNAEVFISKQAPKELQELFYNKQITPQLLFEHPEYVEYLNGKNLSCSFKEKRINVNGSSKNIYEFLSSKADFNEVMKFIMEYKDIFEITEMTDINFSKDDDINQIQNRVNKFFRKTMIKKGVNYPQNVPESIKDSFPTMFLSDDSPEKLKEVFYNRNINRDILLNHNYRKYLEKIDLELLYKYMPIKMMRNEKSSEINLVRAIKEICDSDKSSVMFVHDVYNDKGYAISSPNSYNIMLSYGKWIESAFKINGFKDFKLQPIMSKDDLLSEMDASILQAILEGNMKYDENMPNHFKKRNSTMFLSEKVPENIRNKFYNREFTIEDFNSNPKLLELFGETNIICGLSEKISWMMPLCYNNENSKQANYDRLQIVSKYSKIQDLELQQAFKEYIIKSYKDIDTKKINSALDVLSKISLSNSNEIHTFRKALAIAALNDSNPTEYFNRCEEVFTTRNTVPTFVKLYTCFITLYQNTGKLNEILKSESQPSPILKKSSAQDRTTIIFSDLMRSAFGSNNRSLQNFFENIEVGNMLYEDIKNKKVQYESLEKSQQENLKKFCKILSTLYNNTLKNGVIYTYNPTKDTILDLSELSRLLSPDGKQNYNLRR